MNKYLIKSEGTWNNPSIDSKILRIHNSGYKPVFSGGCIGIIPNGDNFVLLGEDDDHYFDRCNLTKSELTTLKDILCQLAKDVKVKIDYVKGTSKSEYTPDIKTVFSKQYGKDNFKVTLTGRIGNSPLVNITNDKIGLEVSFDISWCKRQSEVMDYALKES